MDAHANGVGFYSLKLVGVCRYLWNVDEVSSPRFLLCLNEIKELKKTIANETRSIITIDDAPAHDGVC